MLTVEPLNSIFVDFCFPKTEMRTFVLEYWGKDITALIAELVALPFNKSMLLQCCHIPLDNTKTS